MTTPELDHEIRQALRAEAVGVDPDADAAWDRVRAELERPAGRASDARWRFAAVAALVLAVALVAGVLVSLGEDEDRQTVTADRARQTTSSVSSSTTVTPTTPTTELPATTIPGTPNRPAQFAAVTQDGRLVVVDSETGDEVRGLAFHGDPDDADEETGIRYFIANATITPDGSTVYYETCCEPAVGSIYRVPTAGSEPERVYDGSYPTVSPDGRFLAFINYLYLQVVELATGEMRIFEDHSSPGALYDLAWSADGGTLLYTRGLSEESEVVLLDLANDTSDLDATIVATPDGARWHLPRLPSSGQLTVVEQCCFDEEGLRGEAVLRTIDPATGEVLDSTPQPGPVVDRDTDASGQWAIVTYADGRVVWAGAGGEGELGQGYVSADW